MGSGILNRNEQRLRRSMSRDIPYIYVTIIVIRLVVKRNCKCYL